MANRGGCGPVMIGPPGVLTLEAGWKRPLDPQIRVIPDGVTRCTGQKVTSTGRRCRRQSICGRHVAVNDLNSGVSANASIGFEPSRLVVWSHGRRDMVHR